MSRHNGIAPSGGGAGDPAHESPSALPHFRAGLCKCSSRRCGCLCDSLYVPRMCLPPRKLLFVFKSSKETLAMRTNTVHIGHLPLGSRPFAGRERIRSRTMGQANLRVIENTAMDKGKALDAALSQIERAFGKGSIMKLGANASWSRSKRSPPARLGLDIALGIGGLPRGRVVEIYRAGILGQDHARAADGRRSPEARRHLRLHRCRACARSRSMPASSASISTTC